jgi:hypothetical protein
MHNRMEPSNPLALNVLQITVYRSKREVNRCVSVKIDVEFSISCVHSILFLGDRTFLSSICTGGYHCGLMVRVPNYRSTDTGSIPGAARLSET